MAARRVSDMSSSYGLGKLTRDVSQLPQNRRRPSHQQRMELAVTLEVGKDLTAGNTDTDWARRFLAQPTTVPRTKLKGLSETEHEASNNKAAAVHAVKQAKQLRAQMTRIAAAADTLEASNAREKATYDALVAEVAALELKLVLESAATDVSLAENSDHDGAGGEGGVFIELPMEYNEYDDANSDVSVSTYEEEEEESEEQSGGIAPGLVSRIPVMSPARPSAPPTPTRTTSIPMPKAQKANAKSSGKGSTGGTRKRSTTLQVSSVESRHSSNALTSAKRNASNVFGSAQVAPVAASNKAAQSRRNESTLFNAQSHVQTTSAVAASTRRNQSSVFG